jgi:alkaline phosphatase D
VSTLKFGLALLGLLVVGCPSVPITTETGLGQLSYESFLLRLSHSPDEDSAKTFLRQACAQSLELACSAMGKDVSGLAPIPVMQGATTDTATQLIVQGKAAEPLYLVVWGDSFKNPLSARDTHQTSVAGTDLQLTQFSVEGLTPKKLYRAHWVNRQGKLVAMRQFESLAVGGREARIAVASCMDDAFASEQKAQWEALAGENPDALFLIGDTSYTDSGLKGPMTLAQLWRRHSETRASLQLFQLPKLIPIFAIWDDHDFGQNDGNGSFALKEGSREIFWAFFGNSTYPGQLERGPGMSYRVEAFGQAFFFLDGRYFRSPPEKVAGRLAQHFGRDTEAWLFSSLDSRTPSWLISGDQFFGGYHKYESYEGNHPTSFAKFLQRLKQRATPIVFLSGDRHLSEVMRIDAAVLGFQTYEFTSSAIHAKTFPGSFVQEPNPRQIAGRDGEINFMTLQTSVAGKWEVDVRAFGRRGRSLYHIEVAPADPATRIPEK